MVSNGGLWNIYNITALTGVFLCLYVMQKTETDRIARVDPRWLQWIRRIWFIALALVLCYSIVNDTWQPSLPVLFLVMVGIGNLAINAIALHLRTPSDHKFRDEMSRHGAFHKMEAIRHLLSKNILP